MQTATRELEEETGLRATKIEKLCEIIPSPGYTNEIIGIFYADEFVSGHTHFDETEELTSFWVDLDEAYSMIDRGEITDAKTLVALLKYKSFR